MELTKSDHAIIQDHFLKMVRSVRDLVASHGRLHKALDVAQECHRLHSMAHGAEVRAGRIKPGSDIDKAFTLHKAAHESARLERLKHKAMHTDHVSKVLDGMTNILKTLAGAESAGDTSSAGSITALASRLSTPNAADAGKAVDGRVFKNASSPFKLLEKPEIVRKAVDSQRRVSPHAHNPHLTG